MKTSEDVEVLGLYMSSCCNQGMIFGRTDVFTRCPRCESRCWWDLEEALVSYEELNQPEYECDAA